MHKISFPDALFVFSMRAPWPTIQSAVHKGKSSYILRTEFVSSLPADLILRAAASWAESIDVLTRRKAIPIGSSSGMKSSSPDRTRSLPHSTIMPLGPRPQLCLAHPREARPRLFLHQISADGHPYRAEIFSLLRDRAPTIGYDPRVARALHGAACAIDREWLRESSRQEGQQPKRGSGESLSSPA